MFLESTAEELYASTVKAFPRTTLRQHATHPVVIREVRLTPFVGTKTLFIKGLAQNEEREYNVVVLAKGVDYTGKQATITASDGFKYSFNKLSVENTNILLRCSCPDFRYRFSWY